MNIDEKTDQIVMMTKEWFTKWWISLPPGHGFLR